MTGVFFLFLALEKLVMPDVNAAIWETFYGISIDVNLSYPIGILNTLMSLALIVGFQRRFTYAYWTLFHFISVASTWNYLIQPFGGPNHLFLAGAPPAAPYPACGHETTPDDLGCTEHAPCFNPPPP